MYGGFLCSGQYHTFASYLRKYSREWGWVLIVRVEGGGEGDFIVS